MAALFGPPDPDIVRAALDDPASNTPWLAQDGRRLNGPVNRMIEMGIDAASHQGAMRMTGGRASPLQNIPYANNDLEHYEMIQYFDEESDEYLERGNGDLPLGKEYANLAQTPMNYADEYANLTEIPTSTTNPLRPRTVAAGYNKDKQQLTVMFRDGTLYNYYEVSATQWYNFRRARSKGRFIYTYLDSHARGMAETGDLNPQEAEAFARIARTAQHFRGGLNEEHSASSRRGGRGSYKRGNLGGSTRPKKFKNL